MNDVLISCCVMHPEKTNLSKWISRIPKGAQIVSCIVKQQDEYESQFEVIAETRNLVSLQYNYKSYDDDYDFSAIRNFIDAKAWGTWLLHIDSDEYIANPMEEIIDEIEAMDATEAIGGWITIAGIVYKDSDKEHARERYALHACRLLKKNSLLKWEGICHEVPSGNDEPVPMVDTNIVLIHDGYVIEHNDFVKKAERNGKLLIREYTRKPTQRVWNYLIKTFKTLHT